MYIPPDDLRAKFLTTNKCYIYSNGSADIGGDPLEIIDRLTDFSGGDPDRIIQAANPKSEQIVEAFTDANGELSQRLAFTMNPDTQMPEPKMTMPSARREDVARFYDMLYDAFEVQPWDKLTKTGCTRAYMQWLWQDFNEWMEKKDPASESKPTSSVPTVEVQPTTSLPA